MMSRSRSQGTEVTIVTGAFSMVVDISVLITEGIMIRGRLSLK